MKDEKILNIKLTDNEPPEHIKKIQEIFKDAVLADNEYYMLISGKKEQNENGGINAHSAYYFGKEISREEMARAFFNELMNLETQTKDHKLVISFLTAASELIRILKTEMHKERIRRGMMVPGGVAFVAPINDDLNN